ncbi:iron ABC transporter permease [Clostridiaceae bacterium M8S5]|nr:iron ABC transporter permease [Clostridiaceae bacterium M8S5]
MKLKITSAKRCKFLIIIGTILLIALIIISICTGISNISLSTLWEAFVRFDPLNKQHLIIVDLRLPRVIASALVGSSLAVAGAIMQGITCNPLADSGILGLNAGAGFALSICFAFFPKMLYIQTIMFCFAGAGIGAIMVYSISSIKYTKTSSMRLVLAGAAVSALLTALSQGIALVFNVAQDIMFWTVGGVCASNWTQITIMTPLILIALIASIIISPYISIMNLGESVAKGLGVNLTIIKIICFLIVIVLAGISVSVVGAVGFIGLIIPHIVRSLIGIDYRLIIPVSAVMGSLLMVLADLVARNINPPSETPIGTLIAIIGVPFFVYLAKKQRGTYNE